MMIPPVTKAGWLGSSWQLPASPQCGGPQIWGRPAPGVDPSHPTSVTERPSCDTLVLIQ